MAGILTKIGEIPNVGVCEFVVDTVTEVEYLPTTTRKATGTFANDLSMNVVPTIGSKCIVGNESDPIKVYMLFTSGWKDLDDE